MSHDPLGTRYCLPTSHGKAVTRMEFQSQCVCWSLHGKPGCGQVRPPGSFSVCQGAGIGRSQPTPGLVLGRRGQWKMQVGSLAGLSPGWVPLGHPLHQLQPSPVSQWPSNSPKRSVPYGCPRWPVQHWGPAGLSHWGCPSLPLSNWAPSPGLPGGSGGAGWRCKVAVAVPAVACGSVWAVCHSGAAL